MRQMVDLMHHAKGPGQNRDEEASECPGRRGRSDRRSQPEPNTKNSPTTAQEPTIRAHVARVTRRVGGVCRVIVLFPRRADAERKNASRWAIEPLVQGRPWE